MPPTNGLSQIHLQPQSQSLCYLAAQGLRDDLVPEAHAHHSFLLSVEFAERVWATGGHRKVSPCNPKGIKAGMISHPQCEKTHTHRMTRLNSWIHASVSYALE